jgi:thioredoxin reductase (NADPH)
MGKGAQAGIDIHYDLREFPKSLAEIESEGPVGVEDVPGLSPRLRDAARSFGTSDD